MKIAKFAFAAAIVVGGIVAAFAFTTPSKKVTPDTWYNFIGNPTSSADIKNPNKYVKLSSQPSSATPDLYLQAIKVELATEVYPATDLTYPNKPIVNVANALQSDILTATSTPTEIADRVLLKPNF